MTSRRGRPRNAALHQAILAATRDLLRMGYGEVTMEAVAARANVGKQTLYRRWTSKAPLVAEAIIDAYQSSGLEPSIPDSGDITADLREFFTGQAAFLTSESNVALIRAVAAAAATNATDSDAIYRQLTALHRQTIAVRLQRAMDRNEVRDSFDLDAATDVLMAATMYRVLAYDRPERGAKQQFDGLVDVLTRGLFAT